MTFIHVDLKISDWLGRSLRTDDLFTIEEVAKMMKKSTDTIYLMRKRGEIEFTKRGKATFVSRQNLLDYLKFVLDRTGLVDRVLDHGVIGREEAEDV